MRESCLTPASQSHAVPPELLTRFVVDGACCYLIADAASRRCVVIDPLPELTEPLSQWIGCRNYILAAVLDTHSHGDHASSATALWAAIPSLLAEQCRVDALGWPRAADSIALGTQRLTRLPVPGHTQDSTAYLLHDAEGLRAAFVGDTVLPDALGRSDFEQSDPVAFGPSLRKLAEVVGPHTLLLPGHDYDDQFACTLNTERVHQPLLAGVLDGSLDADEFAAAKATLDESIAPTKYRTMACGARVDRCAESVDVELARSAVVAMMQTQPRVLLVDVREPYEQRLGQTPEFGAEVWRQAVPLSAMLNALPESV